MHRIKLIPRVKWLKGGGGVTSKVYKGEEDADIPDNTEHKSKRTIRKERKASLNSAILDYKKEIADADSMVEINDIYNQILQDKSNYTDREFNKIMNEVWPAFQLTIKQKGLRYITGLTKQQELDYPVGSFGYTSDEPLAYTLYSPMTTPDGNQVYLTSVPDLSTQPKFNIPSIEESVASRKKQPIIEIGEPEYQYALVPKSTTPSVKKVGVEAELSTLKPKSTSSTSTTTPAKKINIEYEKNKSLKLTPAISYGEGLQVWDKEAQRSYYFVSRGVSNGLIKLEYIQRNGDTSPAIKSFTMPVSIFNKYYNPRYDRSTNTNNGIISINSLANKGDTPLSISASNLKDNSFAKADRERGNNTDFTLITW